MSYKKIYTVKRINRYFHKNMVLTNDEHHQKIQNHINILDSVGIDYWKIRDKIINLAKTNLYNNGLRLVINNLEEFEKNIESLKDCWVYFTDDDDWVDSNMLQVLSDVIEKHNNNLDVIVWPHIRYNSLKNQITGNKNIDPTYDPVPKLQTNHCIVKITDKFVNKWMPTQDIKDKSQHWNLSKYIYENPMLNLNVVEIPDILSLWNNTPISFSWHMHPEIFSVDNKNLKNAIEKYTNYLPQRIEKIIQNNPNTVLLNYMHLQQQIFKT